MGRTGQTCELEMLLLDIRGFFLHVEAEIRALAVLAESARKSVGTTLVEQLLEEARSLGLEQVFVFTYVPGFFGRFGFVAVEHRSLPLKVYNECFHCPKFNTCDEVAMVLPLS